MKAQRDSAGTMSRRGFLVAAAATGTGLLLGWRLCESSPDPAPTSAAIKGRFDPFLRIEENGTITVYSRHSELGQGVFTTIAMLVAEELDAEWSAVRVEAAPVGPEYVHPEWNGLQGTGGSSGTRLAYEAMREVGATARAKLLAAAAQAWAVPVDTLRADRSTIIADDGRRAHYGAFATAAAAMPIPSPVKLKERTAFRFIGHSVPRIDSPAKITGTATFAMDVALPGLLTALVERPAMIGATVRSFDRSAAFAVPGVKYVGKVSGGILVAADNFWAAQRGALALKIEWNPPATPDADEDRLQGVHREALTTPGIVARSTGDRERERTEATHRIEAEFQLPYLCHAAMEPLNATARVNTDRTIDLWLPTHLPSAEQAAAAEVAGIPRAHVRVHTMFVGGSFGRKASPDYGRQAVEAALLCRAPVRLIWRREDDFRSGYFRPRAAIRSEVAFDSDGTIRSWEHHLASASILRNSPFFAMMSPNGLDPTQGTLAHLPYAANAVHIEWHPVESPVPVLSWRDPGPSVSAFAKETLIDDIARQLGRDPLEYRLALLAARPRETTVLRTLRERARWGAAAPGRFQGVALEGRVGEVVELSLVDGAVRVHRITAVVDCGLAVNPDGVRAQIMSGILFGLSAALREQITLRQGAIEQSNYHDYSVLRFHEAPVVDVHLIPSDEPPSGAGEPGTPPVAPALSNALLAATGRRLRALPCLPRLSAATQAAS